MFASGLTKVTRSAQRPSLPAVACGYSLASPRRWCIVAVKSTTLLFLDQVTTQRAKMMSVEILAAADVTTKYMTWLDPRTSLDDLGVELMREDADVKSVTWEHPKRER